MDYIRTCPPVPEADIENLITAIESVKTPTIDGAVLSNLVRVCYECALKKGELIGMPITAGVAKSVNTVIFNPSL